jgi:hypothetical protein
MSPLAEFHLFPTLPVELRLKIFGIAISSPRVVSITCDKGVFQRGVPRAAKSFVSLDKPPVLLHVCHESRDESLNVYTPSFKTAFSTRYTYISFSQDTIRVSDGALCVLRDAELKSIQKMILDVKEAAYFSHFNMDFLKQMQPNLKELELVAINGETDTLRTDTLRTDTLRSWIRGDVEMLWADFKTAIEMDPEWQCPHVNIVNGKTGELVKSIEAVVLGTGE